MCRILQAITYMSVAILSCILLTIHAYILGFLAFAQSPTILSATNEASLFLGAFAQSRNAPTTLAMSVRSSVRTYQRGIK